MIVAILDTLKSIFQLLQSSAGSDGNMIGAAAACIAGCCLGCLARIVQFFNRYAFIEIALYGEASQ